MADWFEKDGVKSTDFGVYVSTFPSIILPAERVQTYQIPGRHGDLEVRENAYSPIILPFECVSKNIDSLNEFSAWLRTRGWLRMGNYPDFAYKARMINQIDIDQVRKGRSNREFQILFDCQPFRYVWPEVQAIEIVTADYSTVSKVVANPGNVESEPRFIIEGTGDFAVTVGLTLMSFRGVDSGVIVDSEVQECFNLEESLLVNNLVEIGDDAFPTLAPGANMISWTGGVTKVTIVPRWRNV